MSLGDFTLRDNNSFGGGGAEVYNVAAGTTINAGEPVMFEALGLSTVMQAKTSTPDASAHLYVGIAATTSTNTASAAGVVWVNPINSAQIWLGNPDAPTTWDTQAEYDALVGDRVLLKNSVTVSATPTNGGIFTVLASDSTNNGCVVRPLDIAKYPGKVAFSFRDTTNYLT